MKNFLVMNADTISEMLKEEYETGSVDVSMLSDMYLKKVQEFANSNNLERRKVMAAQLLNMGIFIASVIKDGKSWSPEKMKQHGTFHYYGGDVIHLLQKDPKIRELQELLNDSNFKNFTSN